MLTGANFSRRVRVQRKPVMPIARVDAEAPIRHPLLLRAMKKSVSDGGPSPEGMNTLTGGDGPPALMRINARTVREDEPPPSTDAD